MAGKKAIKNPESGLGLAANPETGLTVNDFLSRRTKAKNRSSDMADYIQTNHPKQNKLFKAVEDCGSFMLIRDYYELGQIKLHKANFCKKHLLCPFCAIQRAIKTTRIYVDRIEHLCQENPKLKLYLVTRTIQNRPDLSEAFRHLQSSKSKDMQKRRKHINNPNCPSVESNKALGGVGSIEFKRGKNSGLWHPHSHEVWLCEEEPDKYRLSKEWKVVTGDSYIVDVRPIDTSKDLVKSVSEVFKYALKFSELPLEDNWHAFEVLKGKRLLNPFGLLRGLEVPENLEDDPIQDARYIEYFFNYYKNVGYSLTKTRTSEEFDPFTDSEF